MYIGAYIIGLLKYRATLHNITQHYSEIIQHYFNITLTLT